jgi:hypothetical protein
MYYTGANMLLSIYSYLQVERERELSWLNRGRDNKLVSTTTTTYFLNCDDRFRFSVVD